MQPHLSSQGAGDARPTCRRIASELGIAIRAVRPGRHPSTDQISRGDTREAARCSTALPTGAIAIYTATAVLSSIDADLAARKRPIQLIGNEMAIGRLYCHHGL